MTVSFDFGGFTGAIIGVAGTFWIAKRSFKWGVNHDRERNEEQRKMEEEVKLRASRRVASIIEKRMWTVYSALNRLTDQADPKPLKELSIEKGLPDDLILRAFDDDMVTKLYEVWANAEMLQKEISNHVVLTNVQIQELRNAAGKVIQEFHATWVKLRDFANGETYFS